MNNDKEMKKNIMGAVINVRDDGSAVIDGKDVTWKKGIVINDGKNKVTLSAFQWVNMMAFTQEDHIKTEIMKRYREEIKEIQAMLSVKTT